MPRADSTRSPATEAVTIRGCATAVATRSPSAGWAWVRYSSSTVEKRRMDRAAVAPAPGALAGEEEADPRVRPGAAEVHPAVRVQHRAGAGVQQGQQLGEALLRLLRVGDDHGGTEPAVGEVALQGGGQVAEFGEGQPGVSPARVATLPRSSAIPSASRSSSSTSCREATK